MVRTGEKIYLMGVDTGTTNIKAALFDLQGNLVSQSNQPIPNYSPQPGYSEMDPEEIWTSTLAVIQRCASLAPSVRDIRAIAFSSTKGCLLLLDEEDRPLTPLITWRDERATELFAESGLDLYARTGVPASGDTLPKLMWVGKYQPETLRKAQKVMVSQKDYLLHRLVGEFVVDKSLAQTSMLFSLEKRDWDEELLLLGGIRRGQLATLRDDTDIVGRLSLSSASALGLSSGTAVVVGGDDGCMSQVGLGAIYPGRIGANIGTGAAIRAFTPKYVLDPTKTLDCKCLLPYGFVQTGITADAGRVLNWWKENFHGGERIKEAAPASGDYKQIDERVGQVPPGCQGLLFLPYFTQASSTVLKGQASGVIFGLNYYHSSFHIIRAIMEAVGLIYKNIVDRMCSLGLPVEEIVLGGGGSRSQIWRQIIAHILGRPVLKTEVEEASALGAAIMAAIGLGYYEDLKGAASIMVKEKQEDRCYPDPSLFHFYCQIQELLNHVHVSLNSAFAKQKEIWGDQAKRMPSSNNWTGLPE